MKWNMIAGLDKDELVLLKFTEEELVLKLRWEHSKEFEYHYQMNDIVDQAIQGDFTIGMIGKKRGKVGSTLANVGKNEERAQENA
ncbi:MAG: hypothetical protein V1779_00660 [bacterium]